MNSRLLETIEFTIETETNQTLPFIDILFERTDSSLLRKAYRKPTYKNDLIHYHSHHSDKIKSGILIGFFIRALRICSPQYLQDEEEVIEKTFRKLQYPENTIKRAKKKARNILNKKKAKENSEIRRITLPTNKQSLQLQNSLARCPIKIATTTSTTIKELLNKKKPQNQTDPNLIGGLYTIPCKTCNLFYVGETSLKLKDRLQPHDRALKIHDRLNALVVHRESTHHAIDLKGAKIICNVTDVTKRRIIEAAAIDRATTMKQRPGFYNISPYISEMILKENKVNF